MRRMTCMLSFGLLVLNANIFAQVANKKLTGQSFTGEVMINAAPQAVWGVLTDAQKLAHVIGFEYTGSVKKLEKIGDNVPMKGFGDTGTLVIVYAQPAAELRFAWEPDNASYLCQGRWTLAAAGKGSKVTYIDRYTESGPQTPEDIAAQIKSYNEALTRLKAKCEGK
ncbi:MAG: SRPBCC family protein [candidate division KSB1 bacterium]|nr:SRPBCC family protein [candidate division KSB1 bacterium]